jgi:uncharacterized protein
MRKTVLIFLALVLVLAGSCDKPPRDKATGSADTAPGPDATELFNAIEKGDLAAVDTALAKGIDVNSVREAKDNPTALIIVIRTGNLETVRHLVGKKADVNGASQAGPAIVHAASAKNLEMVRFLVDSGANVNASDYAGYTALCGAVGNSDGKMVEYLLSKGADPNPGMTDSPSLLHIAREKGNKDIIGMLEKSGAEDHKGIAEE